MKGINYLSEKDDWKKIVKSEIPAYVSKHNSNHGKQGYPFNDSTWMRMALYCSKNVVFIIEGNNIKTPPWFSSFHFHCLYSFLKKNKLESDKKVCQNKVIFGILWCFLDTKILKFNQSKKFDGALFIIYADHKYLI